MRIASRSMIQTRLKSAFNGHCRWLLSRLCGIHILLLIAELAFTQALDAPRDAISWKFISEKVQPLMYEANSHAGWNYLDEPRTYLPETRLYSSPHEDDILPETLGFDAAVTVTGRAWELSEQVYLVTRADSSTYECHTIASNSWFQINLDGRSPWVHQTDIAVISMTAGDSKFMVVPEVTGDLRRDYHWFLQKYNLPTKSKVWEHQLPDIGYQMDILPANGMLNVNNIISLHYPTGTTGRRGSEIVVLDLGSTPYPLAQGGFEGEGFEPSTFSNWYLQQGSTSADSLRTLPHAIFGTQTIPVPRSLRGSEQPILAFERAHNVLQLDSKTHLPIASANNFWSWLRQTTTTFYTWDGRELHEAKVVRKKEIVPQAPDMERFMEYHYRPPEETRESR